MKLFPLALLSALSLDGSGNAAVIFSDSFESPDTTVTSFGTALAPPAGWDFSAGNVNSNGVHLAPTVATGADTSGDGADDQVLRLFADGTMTSTASQFNHTLALGEVATLTFDYGNLANLGLGRAGAFTVQILAIDGVAAETVLATSSISFASNELTNGLEGDFSLTHTVASNSGERLAIRVFVGGGTVHTVIDNMELTVVPEAGTFISCAFAAAIGLFRRRR